MQKMPLDMWDQSNATLKLQVCCTTAVAAWLQQGGNHLAPAAAQLPRLKGEAAAAAGHHVWPRLTAVFQGSARRPCLQLSRHRLRHGGRSQQLPCVQLPGHVSMLTRLFLVARVANWTMFNIANTDDQSGGCAAIATAKQLGTSSARTPDSSSWEGMTALRSPTFPESVGR